jgi:hypothetical protein
MKKYDFNNNLGRSSLLCFNPPAFIFDILPRYLLLISVSVFFTKKCSNNASQLATFRDNRYESIIYYYTDQRYDNNEETKRKYPRGCRRDGN